MRRLKRFTDSDSLGGPPKQAPPKGLPKLGRPIIVDNFAGGGGASSGMEDALGRSVDIAINHDLNAIAMHKVNHPKTLHFCESVWDVDPVTACGDNVVDWLWLSPDCTHFSVARGGKPADKNIRGLAWVAVKWGLAVEPRAWALENVREFMTWGPLIDQRCIKTGRLLKFKTVNGKRKVVTAAKGESVPNHLRVQTPDKSREGETFKAFKAIMTTGLSPRHPAFRECCLALGIEFDIQAKLQLKRGLGYNLQHDILQACDYGAPTRRRRFFIIARRDNADIIWPEKTHGDPKSLLVQSNMLKPWRTISECIDWSIETPSIFDRKKPLVENTLKRIARGLDKFVINSDNPYILKSDEILTAGFIARQFGASTGHGIDAPSATITANGGGKSQLVTALYRKFQPKPHQHQPGNDDHDKTLVMAHLCQHYGGGYTGSGSHMLSPAPTITQVDHNAMIATVLKPASPNTAKPLKKSVYSFLVKYYGTNVGHPLNEPIQTITSKHRFGLVTVKGVDYEIIDICMRMLSPRELYQASGFRPDYIIDRDINGKPISKAKQVARCGNAVPPPFAEHILRANVPDICQPIKAIAA